MTIKAEPCLICGQLKGHDKEAHTLYSMGYPGMLHNVANRLRERYG